MAVEDACQLLGRYPADKHRLTSNQVARAIAEACPARAVAARAALQQFTLAWLSDHRDLHAKNISILQSPSGEWRVAPIYDIPSTLPYGDHTMAFSMAGRERDLSRTAFVAFDTQLGLPPRGIETAIAEVLAVTESVLEDLVDGALPFDQALTRTLMRQLRARRRALIEHVQSARVHKRSPPPRST